MNIQTLNDLKNFCNSLTEEQLKQPMTIAIDEKPSLTVTEVNITADDFFVNKNDPEDSGSWEEIMDANGDESFDASDYTMVEPQGTIYFF